MIEIVKHGTKKKITCPHCGCVFTYEDEDIKKERIVCSYITPPLEFVICPEDDCHDKVYIKGAIDENKCN